MNLNFTNSVLYPAKQSSTKFCVGNVYHIEDDGSFYAILSQVGEHFVALICLENDSNRYTRPIKVKSIRDISPAEFVKLTGNLVFRPQVEITYIGRAEDVISFTDVENSIEDKNVIPGS